MGKLLAFDIGAKRTGIAETDPLQIIAEAVDTINTTDLHDWLGTYLQQNQVDCLVIGEPKRLHGEASDIEVQIQTIIASLQKTFPSLPIDRQDERFTSKMAEQAMIAGGMKKKKRQQKGQIDQIAAVIILQSYMDRKSGPAFPIS